MSQFLPILIFIYFIAAAVVLVTLYDNTNKTEDICKEVFLHKKDLESGVSPFEAKGHPAPTKEIKKACDYG